MRTIRTDLSGPCELSLVAFLRTGMSFGICAELHRWPPPATINAFLWCGLDGVADDRAAS